MFDVAIIGAGVTGAHVARELTRRSFSVCLLEKADDLCMGASKANSAIVHAGFDARSGSMKARLNVRGCALMPQVARELAVPYKNIGSLVLAFSEAERKTLNELLGRGQKNGVPELEIIDGERLFEREPQISHEAVAALWAPTAGIVCPFELTLAAAENAVQNGAVFKRGFDVIAAKSDESGLTLIAKSGETVRARLAVNAAGAYADQVAMLFGDKTIKLEPRRGQYHLFDKIANDKANSVLFQCPTKAGKGILVTQTVHGNLLIGPSMEVTEPDDTATQSAVLNKVLEVARKSIPDLNSREIITSFAGLRAHEKGHDLVVGFSKANVRLYHTAGIESPGLSAAPAVGEYAAEEIAKRLGAAPRDDFDPIRKTVPLFSSLKKAEQAALAKANPDYGRIVCRCETVTRGDILAALHSTIPAVDIDGLKRRVRPTMGRCQGGFCGSICAEILADELGVPLTEITKFGGESKLLTGRLDT
ncbi:MAG: NAD(P)/FAD-dependent oxidoreductase [Oscillospiraceae bacterium]|jgi:glycerol-3-phosphate dehydrogenase|nr:NAD(P)/FAD-dependent oxidoreductase [Oscillospiraceae bacterium]